jgi:uncharacterized protein YutE (UPF0331/DUF86 family)
MSAGKRPSTYKGLALILSEKKIVSEDFGKNTLIKMAGYRNRMVHFYDEITTQEMYEILQNKLSDIEIFAGAVVSLLKNPENFNLTLEE